MQKEQMLFALLRNAVCNQTVLEGIKAACTAEMLEQVYTLADRHDLAHLAGQALGKLNLPEETIPPQYRTATKQAIFRYMRIDHTYGQICAALELGQIPFIPLKGSVLRAWYPEPWMRTSSDIDILVPEDRLEQATDVLTARLQFTRGDKGNHDVSLFSPAGVHLELHYATVVESDRIKQSSRVLSRVWEDVTPVQPGACCQRMSDSMFYFYHIAHMAKHIAGGGCGIRPFLDLWVLNNRADSNAVKPSHLLTEGGLLALAQAAERLSEVWFSGAESDPMTDRLAQYVLGGGVYGTMENNVTVQQGRRGGKLRYALTRIFLPYETIKYYYPVLQKHKWLLPVYQVVRWCKLLFKGGVKRSVRELKTNASMSRADMQSAEALLQYLDL